MQKLPSSAPVHSAFSFTSLEHVAAVKRQMDWFDHIFNSSFCRCDLGQAARDAILRHSYSNFSDLPKIGISAEKVNSPLIWQMALIVFIPKQALGHMMVSI